MSLIIKGATLSGMVDILNEKYKLKKSGKPFNVNDVKAYTTRGYLPKYLCGNNIIERVNVGDDRVKIYKVSLLNED